MKQIDLDEVPYTHRYHAASLISSKAMRLAAAVPGAGELTPTHRKFLIAALAYFDMALLLMRRYDPNYATFANWKCNALLRLEQYDEAVAWYREIVAISDETDGLADRNATARLAEEQIAQFSERGNAPLELENSATATFTDPPFCMFAEEFCNLMAEQNFEMAYDRLAAPMKQTLTSQQLGERWLSMVENATAEGLSIVLLEHMVDWPARKVEEVGWAYFSVSGEGFSEALTIVVARTRQNLYVVNELEFGRP